MLEKLQSYVKKKYEREEIEFLEPLLKENPFKFRGESHDLRDIVSQMISEHIRKRIEPEVMKHWEGRLNRMDKIIICGGGAHFLRNFNSFLKRHQKQIQIPLDPEMANAIGFYRYGVMQDTIRSAR